MYPKLILISIICLACGTDGTNVPNPNGGDATDTATDEREEELASQPADIPDVWSLPDLEEELPPDATPLDETSQPDETSGPEDVVELEIPTDLGPEAVDLEPEDVDPMSYIIPCETHEDCNQKGVCLLDVTGEKLCFPWCESDDDCPEYYSCLYPTDIEDKACFPTQPNLCMPCKNDQDCAPPSYSIVVSCVDFGGTGLFCGAECAPEAEAACPPGYQCSPLAAPEDDKHRCMPMPGIECGCEPYMDGESTTCHVQNEWGTCAGVRACDEGELSDCSAGSPEAEKCDGIDNDCDGAIDELEELPAPPACVLEFESGACQVPKNCDGGKWVCPEIPFDEICDIPVIECIWWAGVLDSDGDYWPNACDDDDDNDGWPDAEDCAPLDPEVHPGALEECDGIDGDCNGESDFDQLGAEPCVSENQWGACNGLLHCVGSDWKCLPSPPGPDHCPKPDEDCTFYPTTEQFDKDQDLLPDFCDEDKDGDGFANDSDNCQDDYNPNQYDQDGDGMGDVCDADDDNDEVPDGVDCCPNVYNPSQKESDGDGTCDACDDDDDNDEILDDDDNCHFVFNPDQENNDGDAKGDLCDTDDDNDSVPDVDDNCPFDDNVFQKDNDLDGVGDICDDDDDNDGVLDADDNCPTDDNPGQFDLDVDGLGNECDDDVDGDLVDNEQDNCPFIPNPDQLDTDDNGVGDACSPDVDGDGVNNSLDNCPLTSNSGQLDTDGDCPPTPYPKGTACGDVCDPDMDGDGILQDGDGSGEDGDNPCKGGETEDCDDNCPGIWNPDQSDLDGNGKGDACVGDKDGDGIPDDADNCSKSPNPDQLDTDNDGMGDACDADDDNDKVYDLFDNCPLVQNPEQTDTDDDGIGDACDED